MPVDPGLRQRPILALCSSALAIGFSFAVIRFFGTDQLLARNIIVTAIATCSLWALLVFVIPRWSPRANSYLWSEPRGRVSLRFSVAVALVAFFFALLVIASVVAYGEVRRLKVTAYPSALWVLIGLSAFAPTLIGISIGLSQTPAMRRFPWLDFAKPFLNSSRSQFSDNGRLFITFVAAATIALIQGGIVLTGGLSTSFFSFLLFAVGGVATLASDRPAYAIFVVTVVLTSAFSTEIVGSYPPPSTDYYPTAHVILFSLALLVSLLIDLGRKSPQTATKKNSASRAGKPTSRRNGQASRETP